MTKRGQVRGNHVERVLKPRPAWFRQSSTNNRAARRKAAREAKRRQQP